MNWDHIEQNWAHFSIDVIKHWNKLTEYELAEISGNRERLSLSIQKAYDLSAISTEQLLTTWQEQQVESAYLTERATERNGIAE
jgi:hypothetical protein